MLGETELQKCLVNEVQEVYRLQGVNINDKHLETIVRQMMRWVRVEDIGDTEFLPEEVVDKFKFREENERVAAGGRPAQGKAVLLGITTASLSTDSFIPAGTGMEYYRRVKIAGEDLEEELMAPLSSPPRPTPTRGARTGGRQLTFRAAERPGGGGGRPARARAARPGVAVGRFARPGLPPPLRRHGCHPREIQMSRYRNCL